MTQPAYEPHPRTFGDQVVFQGSGNPTLGAQTVDQDIVKSGALFLAENVEHRFPVKGCEQAAGTDVVAATEKVYMAKRAGTIEDVRAVADTVPSGSTPKVTVDYQKSTGGAAFATILTATFDIDENDTNLTPVSGTISTAAYVAGDLFRFVVTVTGPGSGESQAQGLFCQAIHHENPTA